MKFALLTFLGLLLSLTIKAQFLLSGSIVGTDRQGIEFAAVSLYRQSDSTLVKGVITEQDGAFLLNDLPADSYRLSIQSLGYEDHTQPVELTTDLRLTPIILQEASTLLDEVTVTARRSVVENHLGKKVLRLGQDLTAAGSNALEALEMVPSVTTTPQGEVRIRGNANVVIFINGKATRRDPATLRFITAESLEKIEIITNPSAEYDAEGVGGILNLVYKKNKSSSFKLEVVSNLGVLTDPGNLSPNGGINASFTNNKVSFYMNASHDYGRFENVDGSQRNNFEDSLRRYESLNVLNGRSNVSNVLLGLSIEPDSATSIGLEVNYDRWDFRSDVRQLNSFDFRFTTDKTVGFQNTNEELENELWVNLAYEKKFAEDKILKGSLGAGGEDESNSFASNDGEFDDAPSAIQQFLLSSKEAESQRYYDGELNYKAPFFNWGTISTGFKADLIRYHVLQQLKLRSNTLRLPDNDFKMRMQKLGVYVVQKKQIGQLEYGLGLRLEQFSSRAVQQADQTTFTQDYARLFPSIQLNYLLSGRDQTLGFSYTRRINRPGFFDLNPYVSYEDPLNLETGNPAIRPEIANLVELNYHQEWNKLNLDLSLYQRTTNDAIQSVVAPLDDNRTLARTVNIGSAGNSGVELQVEYLPTPKIKASGSFVLAQNRFTDTENEVSYTRQRTWSIRLRQQWDLAKNWRIELSEFYRGPTYQIQQKTAGVYYVNFGLRKKLNNQRGSLSLAVRDVFNTRRFVYSLLTADFEIERSYKWQTRQVTLGFSYTLLEGK